MEGLDAVTYVIVSIEDINDNPPKFLSPAYYTTVQENVPGDVDVSCKALDYHLISFPTSHSTLELCDKVDLYFIYLMTIAMQLFQNQASVTKLSQPYLK